MMKIARIQLTCTWYHIEMSEHNNCKNRPTDQLNNDLALFTETNKFLIFWFYYFILPFDNQYDKLDNIIQSSDLLISYYFFELRIETSFPRVKILIKGNRTLEISKIRCTWQDDDFVDHHQNNDHEQNDQKNQFFYSFPSTLTYNQLPTIYIKNLFTVYWIK